MIKKSIALTLTLSTIFSATTVMHGMQRLKVVTAHATQAIKRNISKLRPVTKLTLTMGIVSACGALLHFQRSSQTSTPLIFSNIKQTSLQERARINKLIAEHFDDVKKVELLQQPGEFAWLPGYLIKENPSRVQGAQLFSACAQKHGLKHVAVPETWLYTVSPEQRKDYHLDSFIVAKKLEGTHEGVLNLAQAKDICCMLEHADHEGLYYWDMHAENLLFCNDGRIGFIDTELDVFGATSPVTGIKRVLICYKMDPQAKTFIEKKLERLETHTA